MHDSKDTPSLGAAPRHLRKRILHAEIPDTLLVPGANPVPLVEAQKRGAARQDRTLSARVQAYGRKRAVALIAVIIVSISIPALVLALILAG